MESIRGITPPFWERDVGGPILASIHQQMNDADFEKFYNDGYSMTMEQAIVFSMGVANA
jgi:hypothetical protein